MLYKINLQMKQSKSIACILTYFLTQCHLILAHLFLYVTTNVVQLYTNVLIILPRPELQEICCNSWSYLRETLGWNVIRRRK